MKIVKMAQFVPGVCLICGGSDSNREWFLDIEKSAEFWGNIYYCNLCCGTMASLFRVGDVAEHEFRINQLEDASRELMERCLLYESTMGAIKSVPDYNTNEWADLLAHKSIAQPEPEIGVSKEPAGSRLIESTDDSEVGELPSFNFVEVHPDTNTGW